MKDVLFIDNYDSYSYNIRQMLEVSGATFDLVLHDHLHEDCFSNYQSFLISPGPGLPGDYPVHNKVIKHCVENRKKYLGICLGLQSLVCYFEGKLLNFETPSHGIRKAIIIHGASDLFTGIPSGTFVGLYHSWYADRSRLPESLRITATSEEGVVMALEHKSFPLYAVQFHPESFMTMHGHLLLNNWLNR